MHMQFASCGMHHSSSSRLCNVQHQQRPHCSSCLAQPRTARRSPIQQSAVNEADDVSSAQVAPDITPAATAAHGNGDLIATADAQQQHTMCSQHQEYMDSCSSHQPAYTVEQQQVVHQDVLADQASPASLLHQQHPPVSQQQQQKQQQQQQELQQKQLLQQQPQHEQGQEQQDSPTEQQRQPHLELKSQLQQCTHWRHLLHHSVGAQHLAHMVTLLDRALQLQPMSQPSAAAAAAPLVGPAVDQPLFEQQQYVRFLQHLLRTAVPLLQPKATVPKAASAAAAQRQELLQLLQVLVALGTSLQQQLHLQLQQLPLSVPLQRQLRYLQPQQATQLVTYLARARPHLQAMPLPLQQQLFATAVTARGGSTSKQEKDLHPRQHSKLQQQQQQQQAGVEPVCQALWAAARLGWQPQQQHLQHAVATVLQQLQYCSGTELVMALWGAARLGVTAGQLQLWWTGPPTDTPHLLDTLPQQQEEQQEQQQMQTGPQQLQQQPRQMPSLLTRQQHQQLQQQQWQQQWQQQEDGKSSRVSHVLAAALLHHSPHLTPRELVGALWAAAELQLLPNMSLLRVLLTALSQPDVLLQLTDEDICSVLRALASVYQKRADVITQANHHPQGQSDNKQQQELEGYLWDQQQQEQQHLDLDLEQQWEVQEQVSEQHTDKNPGLGSSWSEHETNNAQQQQVERRNRAKAYAQQLQQRDLFPAALVLPLLQAYQFTLPTCSSSCIARTLWCVSVIKVVPSAGWMSGVLQQLQQRFSSMDGTSCMLVALALARLRYLPGAPWLKEFWLSSLPHLPPHHQQQQHQQPQGQLLDSSSNGSGGQAQKHFTQSELVTIASSAYQLSMLARRQAVGPWRGQKPPAAWLDALAAASQGLLRPQMDLHTLLTWGEVMMRFSKLAGEPWPGPGAAWWQGFEAATELYLHTAEPKELLRLLKMLSTQQQHMPLGQGWLTTFLEASKACLLDMADSSLFGTAAASAAAAAAVAADSAAGSRAGRTEGPQSGSSVGSSENEAAASAEHVPGQQGGPLRGSLCSSGGGRVQHSPGVAAAAAPVGKAGQHQPLSASNLGNMAKGLTGLGVLPDEAWLRAWQNAVEVAGAGWSREVAASLRLRQRELDQLASSNGVVAGTQSQAVIGRQPGVGRQRSKQSGRTKQGGRSVG